MYNGVAECNHKTRSLCIDKQAICFVPLTQLDIDSDRAARVLW